MFILLLFSLLSISQETSTELPKILVEDEPAEIQSSGLSQTNSSKTSSEDSLLEIPNVNIAGGSNRIRFLQIRGMGETSVSENTPSQSVSFWLNDMDLTGLVAAWPQLSSEKLQIFTGSQSVARGGFSSAGSLQMHLAETQTPKIQTLASAFNQQQISLLTPLDKKSTFFISHNRADGFYQNSFNQNPGAAQNEWSSSLERKWIKSNKIKIYSSHILKQDENSYDVWSLNNSYVTQSDRPGNDHLSLHAHSLRIQWLLTAEFTLNSVSSWTYGKTLFSYDSDWGNNTYWQQIPGWNQNYDYFDRSQRERHLWHQKVYLQGDEWTLGTHVYGLNENSEIQSFKNGLSRDNLQSRFNNSNAAIWLEKHWSLGNSKLQTSIRQEFQNLDYSDSQNLRESKTLNAWAHVIDWQNSLRKNLSLSTRWRQGFKNGGFNTDPDVSANERFYGLEKVDTYEIELANKNDQKKWRWTLFYQTQRKQQVRVSRQMDPSDPSSYFYFNTNAARSRGWGSEMIFSNTWNRLSWEWNLGVLRTQFADYMFENQTYKGRDLAHAPRWTTASSLSYRWGSHWQSILAAQARDGFYFSNNHEQRAKAYSLLHLGLIYEKESWEFSFWIRNLTDQRYATRGFYFANEPPEWQNKLYVQNGPPRTWLVSGTYRF